MLTIEPIVQELNVKLQSYSIQPHNLFKGCSLVRSR